MRVPLNDYLQREATRPYVPPPSIYDRFNGTDSYGERMAVVPVMPRADVLEILSAMATDPAWHDRERNHEIADKLLLMLLADPEITAAFESVSRWHG